MYSHSWLQHMQGTWRVVGGVWLLLVSFGGCWQQPDAVPKEGDEAPLVQDREITIVPSSSSGGSGSNHPSSPYTPANLGGIPNVGNTCYLNSAMQIIAKLYPTLFDTETDTSLEDADKLKEVRKLGKKIIGKIKEDEKPVTDEGMRNFLKELRAATAQRNKDIFVHKRSDNMGDMSEVFSFFLANSRSKFAMPPIQKFNHVKDEQPANKFQETIEKAEQSYFITFLLGRSDTTMKGLFVEPHYQSNHRFCGKKQRENLGKYPGYQHEETSTGYEIRGKAAMTTRFKIIHELPNNILPIKLERKDSTARAKKLKDPLSLTVNLGTGEQSYTLVGFVVYTGIHYYACIKRQEEWKEYNDKHVASVDDKKARETAKTAYMYFYKRNE